MSDQFSGPDPAYVPASTQPPVPQGDPAAQLRRFTPPAPNQLPQAFVPQVVVTAKTPGIAVLLSFLWLGAGHLYAGRTTTGIMFMVANFMLVLVSFIPFAFLVTVPIWIVLFIAAALTAHGAAVAYNQRWGIARL